MTTIIRKHSCKHPVQDKLHGPKNRVMNLMKDGKKARCTACGGVVEITKGGESNE